MKKASDKDPPKSASALAAAPARGPGRPPAADGRSVSRASILRAALRLAKETPLQDLSILMVARSMKIAPGLVHYYLGGRDWLTSGVINLFYKELVKNWPAETGVWEDDLRAAAKLVYGHSRTLRRTRARVWPLSRAFGTLCTLIARVHH